MGASPEGHPFWLACGRAVGRECRFHCEITSSCVETEHGASEMGWAGN